MKTIHSINVKKTTVIFFLIISALVWVNFSVMWIICANAGGSALLGGKVLLNGSCYLYHHGNYTLTSSDTFIKLLYYESISWLLPFVMACIVIFHKLLYRKGDMKKYADEVTAPLEKVKLNKKIEKTGCILLFVIVVIFAIVIMRILKYSYQAKDYPIKENTGVKPPGLHFR